MMVSCLLKVIFQTMPVFQKNSLHDNTVLYILSYFDKFHRPQVSLGPMRYSLQCINSRPHAHLLVNFLRFDIHSIHLIFPIVSIDAESRSTPSEGWIKTANIKYHYTEPTSRNPWNSELKGHWRKKVYLIRGCLGLSAWTATIFQHFLIFP
jgi:hypothetical protein